MATDTERLDKLEEKQYNIDIRLSVAESNIEEIKGKLNKIDSNTSKIIWLVGSVLAVAVLNLIMKGGVSL